MEDSLLQKLANIAIVRQHINHIVNSTPNKKSINPIQKVAAKLDLEFTELLISSPVVNLNGDVVAVNFIKHGEQETELPIVNNQKPEVDLPITNNTRPKVRTSNKKTNAPK